MLIKRLTTEPAGSRCPKRRRARRRPRTGSEWNEERRERRKCKKPPPQQGGPWKLNSRLNSVQVKMKAEEPGVAVIMEHFLPLSKCKIIPLPPPKKKKKSRAAWRSCYCEKIKLKINIHSEPEARNHHPVITICRGIWLKRGNCHLTFRVKLHRSD